MDCFFSSSLINPSFSIPGLFWKQKCFDWNNPPEYEYISLDGNVNSYVPLKTINFAKEVFPGGIEIVQSCNGLLLCRNFGFNEWNFTYYVFNPFTKQHKTLPRSQLRKCGFQYLFNFSLAFDPSRSPYYKVIAIWGDKLWAGDKYRIEVYSSETTLWRLCEDEYTLDAFPIPCVSATFWNGSLNWNADHGSVIYFVIDRELLGVVPRTPQQRLRSSIDITDVTEYQGRFYLIERGYGGRFLNILEMDTAYTGWKVKCSVALEQLKSFRKFEGSHPFDYILFIRNGEEDESSKLVVLTQGNMVLSYALNEMSFKRVYNISPQRLLGRNCNFYQYIESLACV
ncbi:F-box protein At5g07610-like [Papaver somniferum]|uniref:F-box protein At5g07610-like n=1 Tax=Papaver somniferum TaxID=3469 RepID=UPI000E6F7636|nr:F-box protein At5g07610-like [Papaver somniferum]